LMVDELEREIQERIRKAIRPLQECLLDMKGVERLRNFVESQDWFEKPQVYVPIKCKLIPNLNIIAEYHVGGEHASAVSADCLDWCSVETDLVVPNVKPATVGEIVEERMKAINWRLGRWGWCFKDFDLHEHAKATHVHLICKVPRESAPDAMAALIRVHRDVLRRLGVIGD